MALEPFAGPVKTSCLIVKLPTLNKDQLERVHKKSIPATKKNHSLSYSITLKSSPDVRQKKSPVKNKKISRSPMLSRQKNSISFRGLFPA